MKYSSSILAFTYLASQVNAAPSKTIERRSQICGSFDSIPTGTYTINNNLWNANTASPGSSQCSNIDSLTGNTVAWHTR